jgi:hypothetical protein
MEGVMSRRFLAIALGLGACTLLGSSLAAQQPRVVNGQVVPQQAGPALAQTFRSLVAQQVEVAWIGYAVPVRGRNRTMCCWSDGNSNFSGTMAAGDAPCCGSCRIEPGTTETPVRGTAPAPAGPVKLEGADRMLVLFRVANRQVDRVRTFSEDCRIDAGGTTIRWLEGVNAADSIALLETIVGGEQERKSRVTNGALAAISQHAEPSAASVLQRLARGHASAAVRGDAIFWVAQLVGDKAAGTITEAIDRDPETEVKRRAVFALSQLPKGGGVPLLIDVARKNPNPAVRKQAIFWLGQSKDPRALEFFAEILK